MLSSPSFASLSLLDLSSLLSSLANSSVSSLLASTQCYVAASSSSSNGRRLLQASSQYTLYLLPPEPLSSADALTSYIASTAYTGSQSSIVLPAQDVTVRVACSADSDVAVGDSCPAEASSSSSSSAALGAGAITGVAFGGAVVLLLVAALAVYVTLARLKRSSSSPSVSSARPLSPVSPVSPNTPFPVSTTSKESPATTATHNITIRTGKAGRAARAQPVATNDVASLSIPTPSLPEHGDGDGDSDSEHIGGWRGGANGRATTRAAGLAIDGPTEADLGTAEVEMADMSVVEPNGEVLVYIHE